MCEGTSFANFSLPCEGRFRQETLLHIVALHPRWTSIPSRQGEEGGGGQLLQYS